MNNAVEKMKLIFAGSVWRKRTLFLVLGACGGYLYYYFVGCASGACPISSNPYISTAYGAVVGLTLTIGERKKSAVAKDR